MKQHTWVLPNAISSPEGVWQPGQLMMARCSRSKDHEGGVPDPQCSCGIYATTDLDLVNSYMSPESPVLGVVELGGRTIPATQGYRSRAARVAAILVVDEMFTLRRHELGRIAATYNVPALVPHSVQPEDFRMDISAPGHGNVDWDTEMRRLSDEEGSR